MYLMHGFGGAEFGPLWLMLAAGVVVQIILGEFASQAVGGIAARPRDANFERALCRRRNRAGRMCAKRREISAVPQGMQANRIDE